MAAKSGLTSGTIHWPLLIKAAALGAGWLLLPYWLFVLLALGVYLVPFFEPRRLLTPFVLSLVFAGILPPGFFHALLLTAIFFLTLGAKDLILVNRAAVQEVLFLALFFLGLLIFFGRYDQPGKAWIFLGGFGVALLFFLLLRGVLRVHAPGQRPRENLVWSAAAALILWQWLVAATFLPLNNWYQTAVMFLTGTVAAELILDYALLKLDRQRVLAYFSVIFVVLGVLLAANSWKV